MFVDASVVVAILAREPDHEELEKRMSATNGPFFVSPLVRFEAALALARQKAKTVKPTPQLIRQAQAAVDAFVADIGAREVAISSEIGDLALDACASYGKAVGHAADLNFGDCFAYACAKHLDAKLLYKGRDFAQTDLA